MTRRGEVLCALVAAICLALVGAGCGEPVGKKLKPAIPDLGEGGEPPAKAAPAANAEPNPATPAPAEPAAKPAPAPGAEPGVTAEKVEDVLKKKTVEQVYDPINRPDPFKPYVDVPPGIESGGGPTQYELRFYTLRAIAWGGAKALAMVVDPKGASYAVRTGDVIGRGEDHGTVTAIHPDKIVVSKEGRDFSGRPVSRTVEILLHPEIVQIQGGR